MELGLEHIHCSKLVILQQYRSAILLARGACVGLSRCLGLLWHFYFFYWKRYSETQATTILVARREIYEIWNTLSFQKKNEITWKITECSAFLSALFWQRQENSYCYTSWILIILKITFLLSSWFWKLHYKVQKYASDLFFFSFFFPLSFFFFGGCGEVVDGSQEQDKSGFEFYCYFQQHDLPGQVSYPFWNKGFESIKCPNSVSIGQTNETANTHSFYHFTQAGFQETEGVQQASFSIRSSLFSVTLEKIFYLAQRPASYTDITLPGSFGDHRIWEIKEP